MKAAACAALLACAAASAQNTYNYLPFKMLNSASDPFPTMDWPMTKGSPAIVRIAHRPNPR